MIRKSVDILKNTTARPSIMQKHHLQPKKSFKKTHTSSFASGFFTADSSIAGNFPTLGISFACFNRRDNRCSLKIFFDHKEIARWSLGNRASWGLNARAVLLGIGVQLPPQLHRIAQFWRTPDSLQQDAITTRAIWETLRTFLSASKRNTVKIVMLQVWSPYWLQRGARSSHSIDSTIASIWPLYWHYNNYRRKYFFNWKIWRSKCEGFFQKPQTGVCKCKCFDPLHWACIEYFLTRKMIPLTVRYRETRHASEKLLQNQHCPRDSVSLHVTLS